MLLPQVSWPILCAQAVVACLVYVLCLYIYRIYLSPLSRFPGPKLAAATLLYEGYYDLIEDGRYPWRIHEMHHKYGPVVRINPREIHVADPDYVDYLFSQKLDKDAWFSRAFGIPLASQATWSHNLHRKRRGAMNSFFSKASIASRAGVIQAKVLQLCDTLKPCIESGEVVQIDAGFICLTIDIIAQFCYGVDYKYLEIPGYDREIKAMMEKVFGAGAFNRQAPAVLAVMNALPVWLAMRLAPQLAGVLRIQEMVRAQAKRLLSSHKKGSDSETAQGKDDESYHDTEFASLSRKSTIFEQILDSNLPEAEKSEERLVQEGQALVAAGSETTARVLYLSTVHLLLNRPILAQLVQELRTVMPTTSSEPSLQQLEQLPLLTAVIKESIRLGGSTATRTGRMSTASNPLTYKEHVFPPGTPVCVTLMDVLTDSNIFPDPEEFEPMRWLVSTKDANGKEVLSPNTALDKYFVAFSRGPRSCIGMWLAWAELYLAMAHIHRKLEMELYETTVGDVAIACDRFSCFAKPGNKGVRVKITGLRKD